MPTRDVLPFQRAEKTVRQPFPEPPLLKQRLSECHRESCIFGLPSNPGSGWPVLWRTLGVWDEE